MTLLARFESSLATCELPDATPLGRTPITVGDARVIVAWAQATTAAADALRTAPVTWTSANAFISTHLTTVQPAVTLLAQVRGESPQPLYHRLLGDMWYGDFTILIESLHSMVSVLPGLARNRSWYQPIDVPVQALDYLTIRSWN
jgi:hypothetical protein